MTHPETVTFTAGLGENPPKRRLARSLWRGLRCRCPSCGEGRLFTRFLKVTPICDRCGEVFSHHRADDAPPYITIVLVGHIIVPLILFVETRWSLSTVAHLAIWLPATLILSLGLLQPVKGLVVGLQWALRMHGFDGKSGVSDPSLIDTDPEPGVLIEQRRLP
jgi:uncharacterized protein (DUF983 family)